MMSKYDFGIDNNKDGHCDNCGWFVDQYGAHRARLIFEHANEDFKVTWIGQDAHFENISADDLLKEFYIGTPYNKHTNMTHSYWALIKEYSRNNPESPYSCPTINNYLRFRKLPKNVDPYKIINVALLMNEAIDKFALKKTLITYRGMSFNKDDSFVKMLDNALIKVKTQKVYPFVDCGFVSTSLSLNYARYYLRKSKQEVNVLCSFINLPGSYAMPLSEKYETTVKPKEKEILLKCAQKFYICGVQKYSISNKFYYNVMIINSKEDIENVD